MYDYLLTFHYNCFDSGGKKAPFGNLPLSNKRESEIAKRCKMSYNNVTRKITIRNGGYGSVIKKEDLPPCPVATTVQLIGSKWKLLIMRNLLKRPWRFNELKKDLDGISQKILTSSLRSMEEDGIIVRTVYPEVPPRVEYSLSEMGESMRPILDAMEEWGTEYKKSMEG